MQSHHRTDDKNQLKIYQVQTFSFIIIQTSIHSNKHFSYQTGQIPFGKKSYKQRFKILKQPELI